MHVLRLPQFTNEEDRPRILSWSRAPGDRVSVGDILGELETSKAVFHVEADRDGVILRLVAAVGAPLGPGFPLAILGEPSEQTAAAAWAEARPSTLAPGASPAAEERGAGDGAERRASYRRDLGLPRSEEAMATTQNPKDREAGSGDGRERGGAPAGPAPALAPSSGVRAAPGARRLAKELGVDLDALSRRLGGKVVTEEAVGREAEEQGKRGKGKGQREGSEP